MLPSENLVEQLLCPSSSCSINCPRILFPQDKFYLNAHVDASPDALFFQGIRGQLIQSFTAQLNPDQAASPFVGVDGSSGVATVRFEAGGTVLCFDATITGFDPNVAHIHFGEPRFNGPVIVDFSAVKVDAGRFFGCLSIGELGITLDAVCEILADGYIYYFNFHEDGPPENLLFLNTIRGQLPAVAY